MIYFAYGSNMAWAQMRSRCRTARFVCVAKLKDHRLAFTRKSEKRDCGVADVVPKHNEEVWGVIYQIDEFDIGNLDKSEGYVPGRKHNAYIRMELHVYEDGNEKKPISVMTYVVEEKKNDVPPPNDEYKRLIVGGARYWHLPEDYIMKPENIMTTV